LRYSFLFWYNVTISDCNCSSPPKAMSKEVLRKCPFCRADEGKKGKFYLSLNQRDNVFRCWHYGEKGGVCRLESLLTGIPESEITDKYRVKTRRTIHPA
ncbi:hypothetical protein ACFU8X_18025, partial [Brevibacillus porteri]